MKLTLSIITAFTFVFIFSCAKNEESKSSGPTTPIPAELSGSVRNKFGVSRSLPSDESINKFAQNMNTLSTYAPDFSLFSEEYNLNHNSKLDDTTKKFLEKSVELNKKQLSEWQLAQHKKLMENCELVENFSSNFPGENKVPQQGEQINQSIATQIRAKPEHSCAISLSGNFSWVGTITEFNEDKGLQGIIADSIGNLDGTITDSELQSKTQLKQIKMQAKAHVAGRHQRGEFGGETVDEYSVGGGELTLTMTYGPIQVHFDFESLNKNLQYTSELLYSVHSNGLDLEVGTVMKPNVDAEIYINGNRMTKEELQKLAEKYNPDSSSKSNSESNKATTLKKVRMSQMIHSIEFIHENFVSPFMESLNKQTQLNVPGGE